MKKLRCLILGATGLIGSHTAGELVRQGNPVRVFARKPRPWSRIPSPAEAVWADWLCRADLDAALKGIDVVIHLISSIWPGSPDKGGETQGRVPGQPHPDLAANAGLLDGCAANGVKKIVFLSSGGTVYGPARHLPIPESHPTAPVSLYGRLKLAMEDQIVDYCEENGLDWVILRGGNAYGECHNPCRVQGAVNVFLRHLIFNRPIEIWGSHETVRDYLYAGDMARALGMAARSPVSKGIYNLGSGRGTRLKTLVEMIFQVTGRQVPLIYKEGRAGDVPGNVLDIRKIERDLNWRPKTDLSTGIRRTWQWVREQEPPENPAG